MGSHHKDREAGNRREDRVDSHHKGSKVDNRREDSRAASHHRAREAGNRREDKVDNRREDKVDSHRRVSRADNRRVNSRGASHRVSLAGPASRDRGRALRAAVVARADGNYSCTAAVQQQSGSAVS